MEPIVNPTQENFSLSSSVSALVQAILHYESKTFSAEGEQMTLQKAEMIAGHMMQEYICKLNGTPVGAIGGRAIGIELDQVNSFLAEVRQT
jgi:hypothetical protein